MNDKLCFRIIDANLNRAQEALRVVEDWFRFQEVIGLSDLIRELRHNFGSLTKEIRSKIPELIFFRDVGSDPGKENSHSRYRLESQLLDANISRLKESLRSIEENLRLVGRQQLSLKVQSMRFLVYDLEPKIKAFLLKSEDKIKVFTAGAVNLYLIFDLDLVKQLGRDPFRLAEDSLKAGADILQLRFSYDISDKLVLELARFLIKSWPEHLIFINNRPDIAYLCNANLHLGQSDLSAVDARKIVGCRAIIGLSCHSDEQIRSAQADPIDYFTIGPIFPTATKPDYRVVGEDLIKRWYNKTKKPFVLIGGINLERASSLLKYNPWAICVCRDILTNSSPMDRILAYKNLIKEKTR